MSLASQSSGRRARLTIAYDGAPFHGFAQNVGVRTVMGDLRRRDGAGRPTPDGAHRRRAHRRRRARLGSGGVG
ncbi:MAG: hypothetical protein V9E89_04990 [Ilumatobacteraceae bacterium]